MKLWLDDVRPPPDDTWLVFRTAEALLEFLGPHLKDVEVMSLDHDLGEGRKTGYDVLLSLEDAAYFGTEIPFQILVHSDNPVGRSMMLQAIHNIKHVRCP